MSIDAQVGYKKETTWGTAVAVDRFAELVSEDIRMSYGRVESDGLRPGRYDRSDTAFTTYPIGAAGDLVLEVGSKGFGFWLEHMMGGTVTTTGPTDSAYTHTAPGGSLTGKGITLQVGRPLTDGSSVQPFTFNGGKVTSWELANSVEGNLLATLSLDFQNQSTATALATASYPTGRETFSWVGGVLTVGGTEVHVSDLTIGRDNARNVDRRFIRASALKKEQTDSGYREATFSFTADFDGLTHLNRVASATAAGSIATLVGTWQGTTLIGASTYPALIVTLNARMDEWGANVSGPEALSQEISGVARGSSAVSLAYRTLDTTP